MSGYLKNIYFILFYVLIILLNPINFIRYASFDLHVLKICFLFYLCVSIIYLYRTATCSILFTDTMDTKFY